METNTTERLEIENIAEQFRKNQGFTEDANIAYVSGFDTGRKWQYDKLKEEIDLLIEAIKPLANLDLTGAHPEAGAVYQRNRTKITYKDVIKAKELLNNIKK